MRLRTSITVLTCAFVLVAGAACSGGGGTPTPSPLPSSSPSPGPTATPSPAPPSPAPSAVSSPAVSATSPLARPATYPLPGTSGLFVYTVPLGRDTSSDRDVPRRAVIVQDLATGAIQVTVEYSGIIDGKEAFPVGAALAGRHIIVATPSRVTRYALDGSAPSVLLSHAHEPSIANIAISADGVLLAVADGCRSPACEDLPAVTILDIATGNTVAVHTHAALRAAGFRGYAWRLHWREDGSGVVVVGGTGSEAPGGRALGGVDGSLTVYPQPLGYGNISPDGRFVFETPGGLGCMHIGGPSVRLVDLDSGDTLITREGRPGAYAPWEWSPDGASVIYLFLPGDTSSCAWAEADPEFILLDLATMTERTLPGLSEVHRSWYGDNLVEVICERPAPDEPVLGRWGRVQPVCIAAAQGDARGDVFLGGHRIASWPAVGSAGLSMGIEVRGRLPGNP
ncbi:MAG TPA: hypothetical protein PL082_00840 [Tepidiformaceae bacterium]|nr:hypothetical protein [Tepidiformaceae bacterium]